MSKLEHLELVLHPELLQTFGHPAQSSDRVDHDTFITGLTLESRMRLTARVCLPITHVEVHGRRARPCRFDCQVGYRLRRDRHILLLGSTASPVTAQVMNISEIILVSLLLKA